MTVSTDNDRTALTGSEPINAAPGGPSPTETPKLAPGADAGQDDTPKGRMRRPAKPNTGQSQPFVLLCQRCTRPINGSGAGYAAVSLVDAQKTARRAAAGYLDPARAHWHLAHRDCLPEPLRPLGGWFVLWADEIHTIDALLDAIVTLSRQPWFGWTDWQALVRQLRADTESAALGADSVRARQRREQRAAARTSGLATDDPRHGTVNGYDHWGCRCNECALAKSESTRAKYAEERRRREQNTS